MPSHTDARFNWRDPLLLEQPLTHDERMVRDTLPDHYGGAGLGRAQTSSAAWKQPRTPWGDPDLQGIWPSSPSSR